MSNETADFLDGQRTECTPQDIDKELQQGEVFIPYMQYYRQFLQHPDRRSGLVWDSEVHVVVLEVKGLGQRRILSTAPVAGGQRERCYSLQQGSADHSRR
jgi:hypothetical protein